MALPMPGFAWRDGGDFHSLGWAKGAFVSIGAVFGFSWVVAVVPVEDTGVAATFGAADTVSGLGFTSAAALALDAADVAPADTFPSPTLVRAAPLAGAVDMSPALGVEEARCAWLGALLRFWLRLASGSDRGPWCGLFYLSGLRGRIVTRN